MAAVIDAGDIEKYWENPGTISLLDKNLRALEESAVLRYLDRQAAFADFGCGSGESTVHYAALARSCVALDRSQHMRAAAARRFANAGLSNVELVAGSVTDLQQYRGRFDIAVTQRVIINLPRWAEQQAAIDNIHSSLATGGLYLMIENTHEGAENLNCARRALGLSDIRMHWHNNYLHEGLLLDYIKDKFTVDAIITFDLYYLLTRVFASLFARFEGFGAQAEADPLFERIDAAAKRLYEECGGWVSIDHQRGSSFGPIQAMALRKISCIQKTFGRYNNRPSRRTTRHA